MGLASTGFHSVAAQDSTSTAAEGNPATFVLVPGQWTGAFVWHTVAPLLREAGHDVYAVTCTGLGDRVHLASPAIDLDTHITDVVNTIEYADLHDVVLVGHSYAGMIITGVAEGLSAAWILGDGDEPALDLAVAELARAELATMGAGKACSY